VITKIAIITKQHRLLPIRSSAYFARRGVIAFMAVLSPNLDRNCFDDLSPEVLPHMNRHKFLPVCRACVHNLRPNLPFTLVSLLASSSNQTNVTNFLKDSKFLSSFKLAVRFQVMNAKNDGVKISFQWAFVSTLHNFPNDGNLSEPRWNYPI